MLGEIKLNLDHFCLQCLVELTFYVLNTSSVSQHLDSGQTYQIYPSFARAKDVQGVIDYYVSVHLHLVQNFFSLNQTNLYLGVIDSVFCHLARELTVS